METMRIAVRVALAIGMATGVSGGQQQTTPAPPATVPATVPAPPLPADGAPVAATPGAATAVPAVPADGDPPKQTAVPGVTAPANSAPVPAAKPKKSKQPYKGPSTTAQLDATPMLDEEGKQRLDPDGKPMFNPPVQQQRDKQGHPLFDDKGSPVFQTATELGYNENGKKIKPAKEKTRKAVAVSIDHGTLTVDGMTGKAGLNYEIADLKYIYLYAPWVGLTVVSNEPFPGAIEQKEAFSENTLTVNAGEHTYQLYSDKRLLGKKPESAYVLVDRDFSMPVRFPLVGYGNLRKPPYAFPGSKENLKASGSVAPPLPVTVRPALALAPCPQGQMRPADAVAVAGQPAPACVPIKTSSGDAR